MYIYIIINNTNGFSYVGLSTKDPEKTKNYYGSGKHICAAIKKYGKENFTKIILEVLPKDSTKEQLQEREQFWIKEKNTKHPSGYNLTDGGGGIKGAVGIIFTEEHKRKIGDANRGSNNGMKKYGHLFRGENSRHYGKTGALSIRFGMKHSEETKLRISLSLLGKLKGENNGMYGRGRYVWINNTVLRKSKMIKKEDLYKWTAAGWQSGRGKWKW